MAITDDEALRKWMAKVEAETRKFGKAIAEDFAKQRRERWAGASIFQRIGLWIEGEKPKSAKWFK